MRVSAHMTLRYRIVSPEQSVLQVANLETAVREAGINRLKAGISNLGHSDLRFERARLEEDVKTRLVETFDAWGCIVVAVEIPEILRS
ncbi:MAG: hypothetical protein Fur0022_10400 [Anaerolineales bacterium]